MLEDFAALLDSMGEDAFGKECKFTGHFMDQLRVFVRGVWGNKAANLIESSFEEFGDGYMLIQGDLADRFFGMVDR